MTTYFYRGWTKKGVKWIWFDKYTLGTIPMDFTFERLGNS